MTRPKPSRHAHMYYDYHECRDYLQARDGYDERDYAGKWLSAQPEGVPYQDFWHFVCAREPDIRNDSHFTMGEWWKEGAEPWQQALLEKYLQAFGRVDPTTGARCIDFYVSW